jgi:hypothetical protein
MFVIGQPRLCDIPLVFRHNRWDSYPNGLTQVNVIDIADMTMPVHYSLAFIDWID